MSVFISFVCITSPSLNIKLSNLSPSPFNVMYNYFVWMTICGSLSLNFLYSTYVHFSYLLNSTSLLFHFCAWHFPLLYHFNCTIFLLHIFTQPFPLFRLHVFPVLSVHVCLFINLPNLSVSLLSQTWLCMIFS
jgi:hypothetical protein